MISKQRRSVISTLDADYYTVLSDLETLTVLWMQYPYSTTVRTELELINLGCSITVPVLLAGYSKKEPAPSWALPARYADGSYRAGNGNSFLTWG